MKKPGFFKMVWTLFYEVFTFVRKGANMVDRATFAHRMSHCISCDHFNMVQKRCMKCGCFMKAKAKMDTAKCPLKKW
tara:strand:- start:184 stop:414 length:231 start_codon:yes stop_codon:yes gene_type:complete